VATSVEIFSKIAGPIPGTLRRDPSAIAAAMSPGNAASARPALA
jgi:hypothetical protein